MIVEYSNFKIETSLQGEVSMDNYFKYDIIVWPKGESAIHIRKQELFMDQVEGFLSGDEEKAKEALRSVIFNRNEEIAELKKIVAEPKPEVEKHEATIVEIAKSLIYIRNLEYQLRDDNYWIERAKNEAGFIPGDEPWVSIKVETWRIEVSVYPDHSGSGKGGKHWINGEWFDTSFPNDSPYLKDLLKK